MGDIIICKWKDALSIDLDEELNYQFHTIRAAENPGENVQNTDTSFAVNLGSLNATSSGVIVVNVDLAEWYQNPNVWNLNELYTMLMPNYDAQILMFQKRTFRIL